METIKRDNLKLGGSRTVLSLKIFPDLSFVLFFLSKIRKSGNNSGECIVAA